MNPTRIDKEDGTVVLEIKPNNATLKIVFNVLLLIISALGIWLIYYAIGRYNSQRFWFDTRLLLLLMAFFFGFFILFRHWAWFNKGKEVVVVYKDKIHYYRDLFLFAEGKTKTPYEKIEVIYRKDDPAVKNELDEGLIDDVITSQESAIVGFRINDDEVIGTHLPISMEDVKKLTSLINK